MSELPERKVLKNILSNLKAKTITSESRFKKSLEFKMKLFDIVLEEINKKGDETSKPLHRLIFFLSREIDQLGIDAIGLLEEFELYIESLENYSAQLDKTLWDAIEQAKKEAEEQIKQREEIMKTKSPESYIK